MYKPLKIETQEGSFTLGAKRLALPFKMTSHCDQCGRDVVVDLESWPLSYPTINQVFIHDFYCDNCDVEWSEEMILRVSLEAIKPKWMTESPYPKSKVCLDPEKMNGYCDQFPGSDFDDPM